MEPGVPVSTRQCFLAQGFLKGPLNAAPVLPAPCLRLGFRAGPLCGLNPTVLSSQAASSTLRGVNPCWCPSWILAGGGAALHQLSWDAGAVTALRAAKHVPRMVQMSRFTLLPVVSRASTGACRIQRKSWKLFNRRQTERDAGESRLIWGAWGPSSVARLLPGPPARSTAMMTAAPCLEWWPLHSRVAGSQEASIKVLLVSFLS